MQSFFTSSSSFSPREPSALCTKSSFVIALAPFATNKTRPQRVPDPVEVAVRRLSKCSLVCRTPKDPPHVALKAAKSAEEEESFFVTSGRDSEELKMFLLLRLQLLIRGPLFVGLFIWRREPHSIRRHTVPTSPPLPWSALLLLLLLY